MSKRVEKVTELNCLVRNIDADLPDVFDPQEGDVYYSKKLDLLIVIYDVGSNAICAYVDGIARKFTKVKFVAFLASIAAISSHQVSVRKYLH